jgi:DNA gyrase inhibitor GyrI
LEALGSVGFGAIERLFMFSAKTHGIVDTTVVVYTVASKEPKETARARCDITGFNDCSE